MKRTRQEDDENAMRMMMMVPEEDDEDDHLMMDEADQYLMSMSSHNNNNNNNTNNITDSPLAYTQPPAQISVLGDLDGDDDDDDDAISFMTDHSMASMPFHPPELSPPLEPCMTGRFPKTLYLSCDGRGQMTAYQALLRKQIEVFEAGPDYVEAVAQGRNKPITLGQVGIRCRHCAYLPLEQRGRSAVYFPSKLDGVYQMSMFIAAHHFLVGGSSSSSQQQQQHDNDHHHHHPSSTTASNKTNGCPLLPPSLREELVALQRAKHIKNGTGKLAWAQRLSALGVYEDQWGLRFTTRLLTWKEYGRPQLVNKEMLYAINRGPAKNDQQES